MFEEYFRRALLLSRGSFTTFFTRPISGTLLALIAVFATWQLVSFILEVRKSKGEEEEEPGLLSPAAAMPDE
jgi:TctA family transporter